MGYIYEEIKRDKFLAYQRHYRFNQEILMLQIRIMPSSEYVTTRQESFNEVFSILAPEPFKAR